MSKFLLIAIFFINTKVVSAQSTFDKYIDSAFVHVPISADYNGLMRVLESLPKYRYDKIIGEWEGKNLEGELIQSIHHQFTFLRNDSSKYLITVACMVRNGVEEYSSISVSMLFPDINQAKAELKKVTLLLEKMHIEIQSEIIDNVIPSEITFFYKTNQTNFLGTIMIGTNVELGLSANNYFILKLKPL